MTAVVSGSTAQAVVLTYGGICMGEVHYIISEAAKKLQVESHVLRYWEEELGISIGRNEMGHRFYTDDDIQLFGCIKELKEQGMSLKALGEVIPDLQRAKQKSNEKKRKEIEVQASGMDMQMEQLEQMFRRVLGEMLAQNNQLVEKDLGRHMTTQVVGEMDRLMQAREEREEERFRKIDLLIRRQQNLHREQAKNEMRHSSGKIFQTIFQPAR